MLDLDDRRVCKTCGAYSGGNGWCASLPGHPFEGVTIEAYVTLHPEDTAAAQYLRARNEEASAAPRAAAAAGRGSSAPAADTADAPIFDPFAE